VDLLTLARLETAVGFVDHIDAAFATNHAAIAVSIFQ